MSMTPQAILGEVEKLPLGEFESFAKKVLEIRLQKVHGSRSLQEVFLLEAINASVLSINEQERMAFLFEQKFNNQLSVIEFEELAKLSEKNENLAVGRLKHILELAKLRQKSVSAIMDDLGLSPKTHG